MQPTAEDVLELVEKKKDILTIVEGKWDKIALQDLGFTNIVMCERLALYKVVELVEKGSCVQILTDLDAEGKKIYARLNSDFKQRGVYVDNELRELLFKTQLRQIEGIVSYLKPKNRP